MPLGLKLEENEPLHFPGGTLEAESGSSGRIFLRTSGTINFANSGGQKLIPGTWYRIDDGASVLIKDAQNKQVADILIQKNMTLQDSGFPLTEIYQSSDMAIISPRTQPNQMSEKYGLSYKGCIFNQNRALRNLKSPLVG